MCATGALVFIVAYGVQLDFELRTVVLLGEAGATVGALALPELYRRRPSWASSWQLTAGAVGGMVIAATIDLSPGAVITGLFLGFMLGHLAPLWMRHLQLP